MNGTNDARIDALSPLLRRANREQLGAMVALMVDSYGLRAAAAAAGGDGSQTGSVPPPQIPKHFKPPLKFMDMHGNLHENWFDYINTVTDGEFGAISGLDRDDWEPW